MTFKELKLCIAVPELEWLLNAHGEDGVSHGFPDIRRNTVYHNDLLSFHDIYSECLTLKLEFSNLIVFCILPCRTMRRRRRRVWSF